MTFETTDRPFVRDAFETVYRSSTEVLVPGATFHTPMFDAEVLDAAPGGGVARVRLRFAEPPVGDRFRFLAPRDGRLTHVPPPAPGETIELPSPPPAHPFVP